MGTINQHLQSQLINIKDADSKVIKAFFNDEISLNLADYSDEEEYDKTIRRVVALLSSYSTQQIVDILKLTYSHKKVSAGNIPQYSDLSVALYDTPKMLSKLDKTDISYEEMGRLLWPTKRQQGADKKYGENHAKTAALIGLTSVYKGNINITDFGKLFLSLNPAQQAILIPVLWLRVPLFYNFFCSNKSENVLNNDISTLADSTQKRRLSNIRTIIDLIEKGYFLPIQKNDSVKTGFDYGSSSESHYLDYFKAIRTKPFLLLAGISGTGKSRIVRKLAQATVTEELQKKFTPSFNSSERWGLHSPANFELIQVKPNWHNSMDVIGYLSNIPTPHYVFTPFINFIIKAWLNPDVPFFLCVDEMNLAPVEEYFAEFLSAIESRGYEDGEYITDPIIPPFETYGTFKDKNGAEIKISDLMLNTLLPDFKASDTNTPKGKLAKHLREKGLTLPKNLVVIGTVNMDETTFSFSRKVLDRAMSIEMNKVDYSSFLQDSTDDDLKAVVTTFENGEVVDVNGNPVTINQLLVDRHVEAKEVVEELGGAVEDSDARFVIDYLERINSLLEGTPFKLGYRAANEALIYLRAAQEFGISDRESALDKFTLMKILSRIEGDETKLKITDSEHDSRRLDKCGVNEDTATQYGALTVLTAMRAIIADHLGEYVSTPSPENHVESGEEEPNVSTSSKEYRASIKKIDSMISQLDRDHFVSFWS